MKTTRIAKSIAVLASALALSAALGGVASANDTNGGDVRPDVGGSATTLTPTKGLQVVPFSAPAEEFSREQSGQG